MALHVNVGPYDPGPTQQSCGPQLSITHYPSGPLRIYWAGCLRISGNHLFFLRGPATTAGHGTVPGLIGKKPTPVFPRIRTAYQTEAKRKRYHCAIERSCERRLIFFICLISEWFPYVLHCAIEPYRHKSNLAAPACQVGRTAAASTAHGGGSVAFSPDHGRCPQRTAAGPR